MEQVISKYDFNNMTVTEISTVVKQICKRKDYISEDSVSSFI